MANYTPTFNKPYPNGWVDKPSKTTPATAAIMNSYDTAIAALEAYLRDNAIDTVSVSVEQFPSDGRQWLGTITVGSNKYKIYMPSLQYENSVSNGTKIGTITLGEQSFDVYAPASSTGGSTVSVVPKTLTGTNIAEITVDGTTYQLYAPTGGSGGGSTVTAEATLTEGTQIGKITIDGVETIMYAPTASAITVDSELSATSENPVQNKVIKSELDNLDNSKLKGYTVKYTVPANTGGWHKIAQITGGYFNFDLYATGNWSSQRKSNAHFQIQNVNGNIRIVQLSGLYDPSGIGIIRMVRVADDRDTWILEEYSIDSSFNEFFKFTIAGDVTVTPLNGIVDASTDFKDSVSLSVSDIPTGTIITTSNIDDALSNESINPIQNKVVKAEFDQVNSNLSNLKVSDFAGGKNLVLNTVYGYIAVDEKVNIDNSSTSYIFYAQAGKTYSFSGDATPTAQGVRFAKVSSISPETQEAVSDFNSIADGVSTFTTNETGYYMLYVYSTKTSGIKFQIEEGTTATDYEPYIPSIKMLAEENAQQNDSLEALGKCKNLLNPTLQTTTQNGVTCTNNGDGTYTLKGTSTNSDEWNFKVGSATVEKGKKYKIIGFENPTMNARLKADTSNINENESQIFNAADNKEEVYIKFDRNVTFNNEIVKPMLTTNLNATYDDFVPYTGDGDTLTADVATLNSDLSDIKDGTTPVAKAVADEDGNNIKNTYAKKTEVPSGSIVDSELSETSTNPVQNKVVTTELNKKLETLDDESQVPDAVNFDLDSELSLTSVKGVQNKAIAEEFQKYENGTKTIAKATEATTAESATKATQDAQGNVIDTTYVKKTEIPSTPSSLYETVDVDITTDLFAKSITQNYVNCERVGNICTLSFYLQATNTVDYRYSHELFRIDKIPKNSITIGFCVTNFNYSVSKTANKAYNYINSICVQKDYDVSLKRNVSIVSLLPHESGSPTMSTGNDFIGQISWPIEAQESEV